MALPLARLKGYEILVIWGTPLPIFVLGAPEKREGLSSVSSSQFPSVVPFFFSIVLVIFPPSQSELQVLKLSYFLAESHKIQYGYIQNLKTKEQ